MIQASPLRTTRGGETIRRAQASQRPNYCSKRGGSARGLRQYEVEAAYICESGTRSSHCLLGPKGDGDFAIGRHMVAEESVASSGPPSSASQALYTSLDTMAQ